MANLRDIRRRITSVEKTQQITRAMRMVAAAKLRRAQQRIVNARPYSNRTFSILQSVAARVSPELHPLLHTWSLAVEEQFYLACFDLVGRLQILMVAEGTVEKNGGDAQFSQLLYLILH